jgi:serine/threonine protein kinase
MGCAASIRETLTKNSLTVDRNHFYFAKVIGTGGFGTVFSAMHVDYNSWFAVKQISKVELMKHKSGLDMIMGELNAWKKVEHHHYIADLHFAFQDRSYCYFVMDLLTGADLRYYIKKRIILTEAELAMIIACMASALNHLHSKGILHRDIKPENIVFDHEGYPYLTDFGVSYVCEPKDDMVCSLSSGTKQYLAPEVFGKSHLHGPESDFWSLGVMIYEIMYGRRPFDKHVNREFINHVEFETEQDRRSQRGGSFSSSPPRGGNQSPCTSPYMSARGSPYAADTCMSGAVSLANTRTPPPSTRLTSPLAVQHMQHSKSAQNVSPRMIVPRDLIRDFNASSKEEADVLKLPEVATPSSKQALASKKGKFPAMGSLSAASSLVQMLRQEETVRRGSAPGRAASKYVLPKTVAFPGIKNPDSVENFDCPESDGPETDGHDLRPSLVVNVDGFTDSNESNAAADAYYAPPLPASLKVPLPLMNMYHEQVSASFLCFLEGILDIRPKYRLGGLKNYTALMDHEWFTLTELSWSKIGEKSAAPPFVPNREQIQFDMAAKHRNSDGDELDNVKLTEFLAVDRQRGFDDYHHIAAEYKELFPALSPHKSAPGVTPLRCRV